MRVGDVGDPDHGVSLASPRPPPSGCLCPIRPRGPRVRWTVRRYIADERPRHPPPPAPPGRGARSFGYGPFAPVAPEIQGSTIVRALDATLPEPPSLLGQVRRFLNQYGFPEVFDGLPPAPARPVEEPTQEEAQDA